MTQKAVFYIFSIKKSLLGGYLEKAKMRHHASRYSILDSEIMKKKDSNNIAGMGTFQEIPADSLNGIDFLRYFPWGPRYTVELDVQKGDRWNPCRVSFRRTILNADNDDTKIIGLVSIGPDILENSKFHEEIAAALKRIKKAPCGADEFSCTCYHSRAQDKDIIFYYRRPAKTIFIVYLGEMNDILSNLSISFSISIDSM